MALLFKATNIKTGEVIEGTPIRLAEILQSDKSLVYKYAKGKGLIKKEWRIETISDLQDDNSRNFPLSLREEWDQTVKDLRSKIENNSHNRKKRENRFRKPQEID